MLPQVKDSQEVPFSAYIQVTEAAEFLGVHPDTLRRWEKTRKVTSLRHPMNGYRLYLKAELKKLLKVAPE